MTMTAPTELDLRTCAERGITYQQLLAERQRFDHARAAAHDATLEKQEQHNVRKLFLAFGARVYNLSQARASKQSPGLGDLFVVFPELVSFWWETKRPSGGVVSDAQQEFHTLSNHVRSGSEHYIGDRRHAENVLIMIGLASRLPDGSLERVLEPTRQNVDSGPTTHV